MISEFSTLVNVPVEVILGRSRERWAVDARHLYWKLLHEKSGLPLSRIGALNERTHTTVIHGIKKANILLVAGDKSVCRMWEKVKDLRF